jgi:hypothetical protein
MEGPPQANRPAEAAQADHHVEDGRCRANPGTRHDRGGTQVTKAKRPTEKVFIVSAETHRRLKEYAKRKGFKLQYVADEAVTEYLKRKEQQ